jgi:hypothetical protein
MVMLVSKKRGAIVPETARAMNSQRELLGVRGWTWLPTGLFFAKK